MLWLCKHFNISFETNINHRNLIQGGKVSIQELLSEQQFIDATTNLKKHNIMFLEQITTIDGTHLLTWLSICKRNFSNYVNTFSKPESPWYDIIKRKTTLPWSLELQPEYKSQTVEHLKGIFLYTPNMETATTLSD